MSWIIADLDGTMTNFDHRKSIIERIYREPSDSFNRQALFDEFNRLAEYDAINPAVVNMMETMASAGHQIAIMTARPTKYRRITLRWLQRFGITYQELYMREEGDERSDVNVKMDMFNAFRAKYDLKVPRFNILFVLEDRDHMCEMWRSLGLHCWQVQKGVY